MKCEHCGKNEVTFVYQSNINGKVTEKHLCGECAQKLGYLQKAAAGRRGMMQGFFGDSFFGGSLLDDFFAPMPSLLGRMDRMLESPFEDFFNEMPALTTAPAQQEEQPQTPTEQKEPAGEESHFSRLRKRNALKMELKKAVHHEEFERAAQLRDELRALEAEEESK